MGVSGLVFHLDKLKDFLPITASVDFASYIKTKHGSCK